MTNTTDTLRQKIVEFVEKNNQATFVDIRNHVSGFQSVDSNVENFALVIPSEAGNEVVLWGGMTKEGSNAMLSCIYDQLIAIQPADKMIYLFDGYIIDDPSWAPVVLRPAKFGKPTPNGILMVLSQEQKEIAKEFLQSAGLLPQKDSLLH